MWRSAGGHVVLGHARLSVIDLATGEQPLSNEDGTVHVIVNGEFYDFENIRAELESLGHHFRSKCDSEILVHLYEDLNTDCLHRLRGEFAFVLWDDCTQLLFAARDRIGVKPLFYSDLNCRLWLASEVKALHAAGVHAGWDEQGFLERVTLDASLHGRTLFRDVKELLPGHYLLAGGAHGTETRRYWDFDYPRSDRNLAQRSDDEYAEQFLQVLDAAVQTRLRADVRVGCYLSGGIDSNSILTLMSRHTSGRVSAFSVSFDGSSYDEAPLAREAAQRLGASFTSVPVSDESLAADFSDAVWHAETLFTNAHGVAKFALSRAVRDAGVTVVLTGEGADEILGGYPAFVKDSIRHSSDPEQECLRKALGMTAAEFERMLRLNLPGGPPSSFLKRLGYVPAWIEGREWFVQDLRPLLPNSFATDAIYSRLLDGLDLSGQLAGRDLLNQSLYLYNKTALPGYILTLLGDRMEMAHSIEGRLPFLDHHLVEFARQLPASQKVRGAAEKFVLRKALRSVLTRDLCGRRKQAFETPPALSNARQPLYQLMQDTLRGSALSKVPFLKRSAVIEMLERGTAAEEGANVILEKPLMTILSTCVLADRFHL
jgi:asparagine synthase (glutamine-hydrolysing)